MANILSVSAITDRIKARIIQLKQHQNLSGELERLRSALARLEGEVRSRVNTDRRGPRPTSVPKSTAAPRAAAQPKRAAARAPRGQNKAKILEARKDGPKTAFRDLQADRHRHRHNEHDAHQNGNGR
jgi:hypothetical protein